MKLAYSVKKERIHTVFSYHQIQILKLGTLPDEFVRSDLLATQIYSLRKDFTSSAHF